MTSQADKARAFEALHEAPGTFVIANAYDIGSARLLAALGFPALATSSAAFANTLGRGDYRVTLAEKLGHCRALAEATDLPLSADLEDGFAETPAGVAETIRLAAEAGLVGCTIEDTTGDPAAPIHEFDVAVARVAAAVEAARALPFKFKLTARAENFLNGRPDLDDTIRRLQAFEAVGADVLYACGVPTLDHLRKIVAAVERPVNAIALKDVSVADLERIGVKRVSVGAWFGRAALGGLLSAAREVRDAGTFSFIGTLPAGSEITKLMKQGEAD